MKERDGGADDAARVVERVMPLAREGHLDVNDDAGEDGARGGPKATCEDLDHLRSLLVGVVSGEVGATTAAARRRWIFPEVRLAAAERLRALGYPEEGLVVLTGEPARRYGADAPLDIVFELLLDLPAPAAAPHEAWLSDYVAWRIEVGHGPAMARFTRGLDARGHFGLAAALRAANSPRGTSPSVEIVLADATRALWAARYTDVARLLATAPLAGDERSEADVLAAIAHAATAPSDDALATLDAALRCLHGRPELREAAEGWRAELLVRLGRYDEAPTVADHPVQCLVEAIVRRHSAIEQRRVVDPHLHEPMIERLSALGVAAAADAASPDDAHLWRLVEAFGGNRTKTTTLLGESGELRVVDLPTARQEVVALQARLPIEGLAPVYEALARGAARHPNTLLYVTYRGEVLLWEGRYGEALACFEEAWRRSHNRWAHIGRGAALAALGRGDEALAAWDEGARFHGGHLPGEATFVYHAELALERGDLGEAERQLVLALEGRPTRVRAHVLAAEVSLLRGGSREEARAHATAALRRAVALCPGLFLAERAERATLDALLDDTCATSVPLDDALDLCRAARARSRGNASSWMYTWFSARGFHACRRWPDPLRAMTEPLGGAREVALAFCERIGALPGLTFAGVPVSALDGEELTFAVHAPPATPLRVRVERARGQRCFFQAGPFAISYSVRERAPSQAETAFLRTLRERTEAALRNAGKP